ncbi:MAG TPA: glycosyltransferase family 39 protein [Thermoanaerobaculia bacterium]|nr:glycosyltransferase family 39 protein [Thermoanaerobaculia bacterium]
MTTKSSSPRKGIEIWVCAALVVLIAIIYAQAATHTFLNYDDDQYITANPHVQHGFTSDALHFAFTTFKPNWHPLTWITYLIDISVFGISAPPMIYANVLLHIASSLLLFFFLRRTTKQLWPSAIAAAIFALHPLRVESVAWVAERKDVLCALFFFLAIWFYARWTESKDRGYYIASVAMFAIGLTAKGMIVTLPFVLLLIDYWPLQRGLHIKEKIPFFVVLVPGIATMFLTQRSINAIASEQHVSRLASMANAVLSYVAYIGKMLWPVDLVVPYPLRLVIAPSKVFLALVLLIAITLVAWSMRKRHRYLLTGWLWYLGMMVPVIGFIQLGSASMADRYTYLPQVGLTFAIVWLFAKKPWIAAVPLVVLVPLSFMQVGYWKNAETLFQHSIANSERNRIAMDMLGLEYNKENRHAEAAETFRAALALKPDDEIAVNGLAEAGGAAAEHNNRAAAFARAGRDREALAEYDEALRLDPHQYDARMNLGALLSRMNDNAGAAAQFEAAAKERPTSAEPHVYLALVYATAGQNALAIQQANAAVAIDAEAANRVLASALQRPVTIDEFVQEMERGRPRPQ